MKGLRTRYSHPTSRTHNSTVLPPAEKGDTGAPDFVHQSVLLDSTHSILGGFCNDIFQIGLLSANVVVHIQLSRAPTGHCKKRGCWPGLVSCRRVVKFIHEYGVYVGRSYQFQRSRCLAISQPNTSMEVRLVTRTSDRCPIAVTSC